MTAYSMQGDREKCLHAGMDSYLSKPARPHEIIATLRDLLSASCTFSSLHAEPEQVHPSVTPLGDVYEKLLPAYNKAELLARVGGKEDLATRFIAMFIKNVTGYMDLLQSAIFNSDLEQARIQAHTIKGAAANIAANQMHRTAAIMEERAKSGSMDEVAALLSQLQNEFSGFIQESAAE